MKWPRPTKAVKPSHRDEGEVPEVSFEKVAGLDRWHLKVYGYPPSPKVEKHTRKRYSLNLEVSAIYRDSIRNHTIFILIKRWR